MGAIGGATIRMIISRSLSTEKWPRAKLRGPFPYLNQKPAYLCQCPLWVVSGRVSVAQFFSLGGLPTSKDVFI